MRIDEGKLVAILVEKTEGTPEEVRDQLAQLKDSIKKAAASGEEFKIPKFGTFSRREGVLHFEPDDQLKTEINQKYVGMRPIELVEAFKDSGAGIPVEEPSAAEDQEEEDKSKSIPAAEAQEDDTELQKQSKPSPNKEKTEESKSLVAESEDSSSGKDGFSKPSFRSDREKSKSFGKMGVAVVLGIVILIAAGLLLYFGIYNQSDGQLDSANTPADTLSRGRSNISPAGNSAGSTVSQDSTEQNALAKVSTTDSASEKNRVSSKYGLKGKINVRLEKVYTIVIHSFRLKSTIKPIADSLHQQGYRTILFRRSENESSRWRLGLGQFKTIKEAQKAAETLSDPYKNNHFITHI